MPAAEQKSRALVMPAVLVWAREEAGFEREVVARKLSVKPERLAQWETGEARPTLPQLLNLSRVYKRNPAVFYLEHPPEEHFAVHDFRRLPEAAPRPLSPELRYEIRLAHTRREVLLSIRGADAPASNLPRVAIRDQDPESAAGTVRDHLGVTLREQRGWRNPDVAFKRWRGALENIGVLVFQTTRVDTAEMRGFSIAERSLPVVLLNGGDAPAGKCFSAIHELCHLVIRDGGLCLPGDWADAVDNLEMVCNRIAGAVLVPATALLGEAIVSVNTGRGDWSDADLRRLAGDYGVSREVVLRRLLILGRTTERFYRRKRQQYQEEWQAQEERQTGGYAPPHAVALNRVGRLFARTVLESFYDGRLSASDLPRYLGLKLGHLPEFEAAVYGR